MAKSAAVVAIQDPSEDRGHGGGWLRVYDIGKGFREKTVRYEFAPRALAWSEDTETAFMVDVNGSAKRSVSEGAIQGVADLANHFSSLGAVDIAIASRGDIAIVCGGGAALLSLSDSSELPVLEFGDRCRRYLACSVFQDTKHNATIAGTDASPLLIATASCPATKEAHADGDLFVIDVWRLYRSKLSHVSLKSIGRADCISAAKGGSGLFVVVSAGVVRLVHALDP